MFGVLGDVIIISKFFLETYLFVKIMLVMLLLFVILLAYTVLYIIHVELTKYYQFITLLIWTYNTKCILIGENNTAVYLEEVPILALGDFKGMCNLIFTCLVFVS